MWVGDGNNPQGYASNLQARPSRPWIPGHKFSPAGKSVSVTVPERGPEVQKAEQQSQDRTRAQLLGHGLCVLRELRLEDLSGSCWPDSLRAESQAQAYSPTPLSEYEAGGAAEMA